MFRRLLLAAVLTAFAGPATAAPITYTAQVTASGSLNGVPFTDALVTLTSTADTGGIMNLNPGIGLYQVVNQSTAFTVAGVGSGTFTNSTDVIVQQSSGPPVGAINQSGTTILGLNNVPAFATYDLSTAIGPVSGNPIINSGLSFPTTGGALILDSATGDTTFTAALVPVVSDPVPEPATLAVFAGLIGAGGLVARRRKSATA